MSSSITVERVEDRITLRGWCGPDTPKLCKSVGGGKFTDKPSKHWQYPLDLATCRRMREVFGSRLVIGKALNEWARDEIEREKALTELAKSTDAETTNVQHRAPRIAELVANRTYQRVAIAYGAEVGSFLNADQPGLGKTIETLGTLVEQHERGVFLVACPSVAVNTVWEAEIRDRLPNAHVFAVTGSRPKREETLAAAIATYRQSASSYVFVIVNLEMARLTRDGSPEYPELHTVNWTAFVVDESHRALIHNTGSGKTLIRAGFVKIKAAQKIALSGTPMRGKPKQLWGTLNFLRPDLYTSYWNWVGRYFTLSSNGYSNYVIGEFKTGGQEALARDIQTIMLRRTKAEVLAELPPKVYAGYSLIPGDENSPHGVWLAPTPKQAKMYRDFERNASIDFEGGEFITADGELAEYTRRKQLASAVHKMVDGKMVPTHESCKFNWLVEKVDELGIIEGEGDGKIVVVSQFTKLLEAFRDEMEAKGIQSYILTGETKQSERSRIIEEFQSEQTDVRVFFLNLRAGGVAVTLDAADDLVMLDETTIPDEAEQVEDRLHRTSRMHNVTIHYLRTLDTIDEEIMWVAAAREDVQKYMLDGLRGVDFARKLYETSRQKVA